MRLKFFSNVLKKRRRKKLDSRYGPLFSTEHKKIYDESYKISGDAISALCFNSRFGWSADRFYQFKVIEDCVCLYCEGEEGLAKQHIVMPLGDISPDKIKTIASFYYPAFEATGNLLKIMFVPDKKIDIFKSIEGYECEVFNSADFDEYVYESKSLRELKGKQLKSKKNLLNRFFRDCTGCEFIELTKKNMSECLELTEKWCEERGIEKDDLRSSDYIPIKLIFENFDDLDIRGGAIKLHKKMIAFFIGSEPLGDTGFVHFEKVDHVINGANVAIVVAAVENMFSDAKYINREEDMGIEGLRTAKQAYMPVYMTHKSDIFLKRI